MRVTIADLFQAKRERRRFAALTAYDAVSAGILDSAGIPLLLVGDSLGMVVLGHETTLPVTLEDILHHTRAVVRGSRRAMVVADLPFMTYQISIEQAMSSAARCLQEAGAQAVKLEGGRSISPTVRRLTEAGIPVMGHIGLTPQSVHQLSGFRVQGKTAARAKEILADAQALESAGAFSVVLECIPTELAGLITERLSIPTLGIGAGPLCDAEIQVTSDILGWTPAFVPRHARAYAQLAKDAATAVERFQSDVASRAFPGPEQSTALAPEVAAALRDGLADPT
ncbi:MAG: 3-methyl-2-oxobutanoate hydroxymethyltransferase [Candidatus Bipolaricaulota bacterium]